MIINNMANIKPIKPLGTNTKSLSLTQAELFNLLIKYKIPVAKQTIEAIKQHTIYTL